MTALYYYLLCPKSRREYTLMCCILRWTPSIHHLQQLPMRDYLQVDVPTLYSLGVLSTDDHPAMLSVGKSKEGLSLISILDETKSPLGRKLLRTWILRPLIKADEIALRTEGVRFFASPGNTGLVGDFHKLLRQVKDVPRMMLRLRQASSSVLDWLNLALTFKALDEIRHIVCQMQDDELPRILAQVQHSFSDKCHNLHRLLENVVDFPESKLQRRLVVLEGVDEDLDEEKRCYEGLGDFLEEVARQEVDDLGEPDSGEVDLSLSVVFFPQIGYLVAISADHNQKQTFFDVPPHFSSEEYDYYKTPRMIQLDEELGDISSKIFDREFAIVDEVRMKILTFEREILETCRAAATLDCVLAFAVAAVERDWVEPELVQEPVLLIEGGRHPLCELCVDTFVPNDTVMDAACNQPVLQVLTGPNNSGKSIYLKQVGLIVYLAHLGSWVPAKSCQLGLTDRIFSRIQSLESCSMSHSSFGIDLNQVSVMLRNSTPKSLLLIDEFGKGTQSSDGVALLAATISYLDKLGDACPRTVVATHFHELCLQVFVLLRLCYRLGA
jgi:DNA mismatch repair protein MSH5